MIRTVAVAISLCAAQSPQAPVFKTRTDLARLDVIVTDNRTGRPVTDLTARDFTIRENGVPQTIALFVNEPFVAAPPESPRTVVRGGAADARSRRVFLFYPTVAGSLQQMGVEGPVKPLEGAARFVRQHLLPQDLVGTIAFNRVTDLTTDHEYVARVIERLKKNYKRITHEWLKYSALHQRQCRDVPEHIQSMIDALFDSEPTGVHRPRSLVPFITGAEEFRVADRQLRCGAWNARMAGNSVFGIYAGIEYLRPLAGQKHLITLSTGFLIPGLVSHGLFFRDASEEARLAARANDAEVALDVVDTRGTQPHGRVFSPPWARLSMMNLSALGGGRFTSVLTADEALRRLGEGSRHSYVLGYAPTSPALDGRYRDVEVRVNRRDVTVTYRGGYTATADVPRLDLRAMEVNARLRDAAGTDAEHTDIRLKLEAGTTVRTPQVGPVRVTLTIDASRLSFRHHGEKRQGVIDVLIVCGDKNQQVVGRIQHQLSMSLDEDKYRRAVTEGMPYTVTIPITAPATHVKAVVYDYESDLVGTAVATVK